MPRQKQTETSAPPSAARIHCPACRSEIGSDGATLHARSGYLDELLETESDVEKLEKLVEGLEQKLSAAKQELEQVKAEKSKTEGKDALGQKETGKQRDDWW